MNEVNPESQYGYRVIRGTVDMLFAARHVEQKYKATATRPFFIVFVDLTVSRALRTLETPSASRFSCKVYKHNSIFS